MNGVRTRQGLQRLIGYAAATMGVALMTGVIYAVSETVEVPNISMLYLLVVIGVAVQFGSRPAVFASVLAFLAFDFLIEQPRFHVTVRNPGEWLALALLLSTALVMGRLTAQIQASAAAARQRAREATALSGASWAVASQVDRDSALVELLRQMIHAVEPEAAAIVVRGERGDPEVAAWCGERRDSLPNFADGAARRAVEAALETGDGGRLEGERAPPPAEPPGASYLPLRVKERVLGVLYLQWRPGRCLAPNEREVVQSLANHAAVVLERDRLARAEARVQALAETDRMKSVLLSMVSHNLRSPLAAIKASVGGLRQHPAAGAAAAPGELLEGIDHEVDRLNRMVANLLALSRLEADAWRSQHEQSSIPELVGAAFDTFRGEDRQRIRVTLDPSLPELWLDPVQIAEALCSLLDNALRYSPPDSPVELRAGRREGAVVLAVLDRGPGLPPGEEERVFERFYRGPGLQESARPGMGLGLSIARGLVEAHGGQLTARPREGGGAVFEIRLPVLDSTAPEDPNEDPGD